MTILYVTLKCYYISFNKVLHINSLCCISRSVGFKGSSRSTGFDDKQTIINPIFGVDEANETVSSYIHVYI